MFKKALVARLKKRKNKISELPEACLNFLHAKRKTSKSWSRYHKVSWKTQILNV